MKVIIFCNAVDDRIKQKRGIETDSPAATKKILELCNCIAACGGQVLIASMGRGKPKHKFDFFGFESSLLNRVRAIYAPFSNLQVLSQVLTFIFLPFLLKEFVFQKHKIAIFYNKMPAYLLSAFIARILGYTVFLQLEDGNCDQSANWLVRAKINVLNFLFSKCLDGGALIANSQLKHELPKNFRTYLFYGAVKQLHPLNTSPKFQSKKISCLISGTLSRDTGVSCLVEAIRLMAKLSEDWIDDISIHVSGYGEILADLETLSCELKRPELIVHGRLPRTNYDLLLNDIDLGFALKPPDGRLAKSTFPSKVIEYASEGILVLTTDISDVKKVFGQNVFYLNPPLADSIVECLRSISSNRQLAANFAKSAQLELADKLNLSKIGREITDFLKGAEKFEV